MNAFPFTLRLVLKPASLMLLGIIACAGDATAGTIGGAIAGRHSQARRDLIRYADPMDGTGGNGHTFPGAVAPFGMIQWSPDTGAGHRQGGYSYDDSRILGFSLDHLSGAGCEYGGDFSFMPRLGAITSSPGRVRTAFAAPFSHRDETARPGYYAVTLGDGIRVELTTTTRTGFGRFTYPAGGTAAMTINAASDQNGATASAITLNPGARTIAGWALGGRFCHPQRCPYEDRKIYFYAVFDRPFASWATWSNNVLTRGATKGSGTAAGACISFDLSRSRTLLVKVGISYVSLANAKANVEAESPPSDFSSRDFQQAVAAAGAVWNSWLNRVQIDGGSPAALETFYSMLYHALLAPTVCSDANGEYRGYDGEVHRVAPGRLQYADFSGWDIYRSECQLLAMLAPERASDMAQALLLDYRQGGAFPRWGLPTGDSGVMTGDPAAPMIADFYAFGATQFDARDALAGLVRAATDPAVRAPRTNTNERDELADYLRLGYVPEHQQARKGSVSLTLEYASADFAVSRLAHALGDKAAEAHLLRQAQNWRHLFNPATGYLQMRRRDGSWAPGFANNVETYDGAKAYVEGTAGQYLWMVPFNLAELAKLLGGPRAATARLDAFFRKLNVGRRGKDAWMANLGNEPCLETPWIYCFWGRPDKTQQTVRRAMTELFSNRPHAYPGNDDLGEMSSWYIFAALGMYPELPGSDILVLGSPLFPRTVLHLRNGDVTIIGHGAVPAAPYVRHLTINGRSWEKPWIRFGDIARGGTMIFDLAAVPDPTWGRSPADAPPSYGGGVAFAHPSPQPE